MRVSPARVVPDTITVTLVYDPDARVWYTADCLQLPGLVYKGQTIDEVVHALPSLAKALVEFGRDDLKPYDLQIRVRLCTVAHIG
jgi:hypothetical protein